MNLDQRLENKRKEMLELAEEKGYHSPEVLKISQEIDEIIFDIQKAKSSNNNSKE